MPLGAYTSPSLNADSKDLYTTKYTAAAVAQAAFGQS